VLYRELTPWYRLVDPPRDHLEEAGAFQAQLERVVARPLHSLLELGSGAGHNALHLRRRFTCTLSDLSEPMLALSRELNPGCEHVQGDMRTLRLGRTFDAVLVHDAISYMLSEEDLSAAFRTVFEHLRPGGAAIFAPDCLREHFADGAELLSEDDGARSMRCVMWQSDPDPSDSTFVVDYGFLFRDGTELTAVHDRHVEGLFPKATWLRLLEAAGFQVETFPRPLGDGAFDESFLARRPESKRSV
jgi:SAM-dependent methyltransferase